MENINSEPAKKHNKLKWALIILGFILLLLFIFRFQINGWYCSTLPDKPSFISTGQEQGECYLDLNIKSNNLNCFPFRQTGGCISFDKYTPVSTSLIRFNILDSYESKTLEECKKINDSGNKAYCVAYLAGEKKDASICDTLTGEGFGNLRYDCIIYASFKARSYFSCFKIDANDWRHNCIREVNIGRCVIDKSFCLI